MSTINPEPPDQTSETAATPTDSARIPDHLIARATGSDHAGWTTARADASRYLPTRLRVPSPARRWHRSERGLRRHVCSGGPSAQGTVDRSEPKSCCCRDRARRRHIAAGARFPRRKPDQWPRQPSPVVGVRTLIRTQRLRAIPRAAAAWPEYADLPRSSIRIGDIDANPVEHVLVTTPIQRRRIGNR